MREVQTSVPIKVLYREYIDQECSKWSVFGIRVINFIMHHLIRAALIMWQHQRSRGENQEMFGLSSAFLCLEMEVENGIRRKCGGSQTSGTTNK